MRSAILLLITLFLSDLTWKTESYDHCSCFLEQKNDAAEVAMRCSCPEEGSILKSQFQQRKYCSVTTTKNEKNGPVTTTKNEKNGPVTTTKNGKNGPVTTTKNEKNGKMDVFRMKMKCPRPDCTMVVSNENFTVSPGLDYYLNDVATITCNDGHVLSGLDEIEQSITCTEKGFNMDAIIPCTIRMQTCVLDELLMNRMFSISPAPHYILNDVVTITCIDGHVLSSLGDTQQNISCTENGFNMDDIIPCTIRCTLEQSLLNDTLVAPPVQLYLLDDIATITCIDGYAPSAIGETEQNISCTESGFNMDEIMPCTIPIDRCPNLEGIYEPELGLTALYVSEKLSLTQAMLGCKARGGLLMTTRPAAQEIFVRVFSSILYTAEPLWFQKGAFEFVRGLHDGYVALQIRDVIPLPFFCDCGSP